MKKLLQIAFSVCLILSFSSFAAAPQTAKQSSEKKLTCGAPGTGCTFDNDCCMGQCVNVTCSKCQMYVGGSCNSNFSCCALMQCQNGQCVHNSKKLK